MLSNNSYLGMARNDYFMRYVDTTQNIGGIPDISDSYVRCYQGKTYIIVAGESRVRGVYRVGSDGVTLWWVTKYPDVIIASSISQ